MKNKVPSYLKEIFYLKANKNYFLKNLNENSGFQLNTNFCLGLLYFF